MLYSSNDTHGEQENKKVFIPKLLSYYRTECKYRRHLSIVAIVITVGDSNPPVYICGNDGGNYGFAKIIIYLNDDTHNRYGTY